MKDVYFSPDRKYVVAFYRDKQDYNSKERLKKLVTQYYDSFFNREGGEYYKELYCWPTDMVELGWWCPPITRISFSKKAMLPRKASKARKSKGYGLHRLNFVTGALACALMKVNWVTG